jgi:putative RNA 2'-phosphotransferase
MTDAINYELLGRSVSHALRHAPGAYSLQLDENGWGSVADLVRGLRSKHERWRGLREEHLQLMVAVSLRRRHEIRHGKIRALYGYSLGAGRRLLDPKEPPVKLFHGTGLQAAVHILRGGLCPMRRQHVHLTTDREYALSVKHGARAQVVLMMVRAREAFCYRAVAFYEASEHVWLSGYVPPEFIDLENRSRLLAEWNRRSGIQTALSSMSA